MVYTAAKTASTTASPIFFVIFFVILAFVGFVFIRGLINSKKAGGVKPLQVEGKVVASRIQARVKGTAYGMGTEGDGIAFGTGRSVGRMREDGTTVNAGVGAIAGPDGIGTHAGVHINKNYTNGLNLLPHIPVSAVDYFTVLSIEYTDPETGNKRLVKAPLDEARAAKHLPQECLVLESVTNTEIIDPGAITDGFAAIKAGIEDAKRVREQEGDFNKNMLDATHSDQRGFTFLNNPIPVTVHIKDLNGFDSRVLVSFQS